MTESGVVEHKSFGSRILQVLPPRFRDPKKLQEEYQTWVVKQPVPVEAAISALAGSFQGLALGGVMGALMRVDPNQLNQASTSAQNVDLLSIQSQMGGPWTQARNFAVITGVHAGIATAVKRIRKKEDTYTAMIAAFGSGAAFNLVSGITQGNKYQGAFTTGVMFALFQGAFHKLGKKFSAPKRDPVEYLRARQLLTSLGFPEYAKNIQKGRLNDYTMWLWNDSALQEVRIPPGPRLLILNHVDRYREKLKPPMPYRKPAPPTTPQPPPPAQKQ